MKGENVFVSRASTTKSLFPDDKKVYPVYSNFNCFYFVFSEQINNFVNQ